MRTIEMEAFKSTFGVKIFDAVFFPGAALLTHCDIYGCFFLISVGPAFIFNGGLLHYDFTPPYLSLREDHLALEFSTRSRDAVLVFVGSAMYSNPKDYLQLSIVREFLECLLRPLICCG